MTDRELFEKALKGLEAAYEGQIWLSHLPDLITALRERLAQSEQPGEHSPAPTIPLGATYDKRGKLLTFRDSNGCWHEYTRDKQGKELKFRSSDGFWNEYTYDSHGNELTYKNSDGHWFEFTYDAHGNVLTRRDSNGYWHEYTRDAHGNVLTYREGESE